MEYILYNTATETLETYQRMDEAEAMELNDLLRTDGDDRRWIPVLDEDEVDEEPVPYTVI